MWKSFGLTGLTLLLGLSTISAREPTIEGKASPDNALHVTIIYDNYQEDPALETDWGFACLVEYQGKQLLFDAGRKAELYKKNMEILEIDPSGIPSLFISHKHGDHTAGIPWITESNPDINCYLPASFADQLKTSGTLPPNSIGVHKPMHLYGPYYSTGDDFEAFREHGLVVKTKNGGVLITGCGHPGVINMLAVAEEELGIEMHTVIGGMHLMRHNADEMEQIASDLKKIGISRICPTHCTGDKSIAALKESFGPGYISGGTGKEIIIQ